MKFHCYADTDSLYIELSEQVSADSQEVAAGVVLDFGANGALVGIDIDHASKVASLSHLEIEGLSMSNLSFTQ